MGIINRRNALLGWSVWKIAMAVGRRKARAAVRTNGDHARLSKAAIASTLAAAGALWAWRKKSDDSTVKS
jgi:hypothetical protein